MQERLAAMDSPNPIRFLGISVSRPAWSMRLTWADLMMLAVAFFWGTGFSFVKAALAEVPPFAFNALRFPLAVILLLLAWKQRGMSGRTLKADVWALTVIGVLGYVGYQMFYITGIARTTASNSALILASVPAFVAAIHGVRGTERLGWVAWLGVLLSIAGIALIIRAGGGTLAVGDRTLLGDVLVVVAAFAWASYTVATAPYLARHAALGVTLLTMGAATIVLLLAGAPQLLTVGWGSVSPVAWAGVLYTGILGVAGAYLLWNLGVQRLGGTRAAIYSNLVPVIAVVTAALTLHEQITSLHLVGGAVILFGIVLTRRKSRPSGQGSEQ